MVDLNGMLGDWESAGYSEAQAVKLLARAFDLLAERVKADVPEQDRGDEGACAHFQRVVWPGLLAQATRDVSPDLIPPPTVREYEVDPDDFLAVYRDEGAGPMKLVGVEYQAQPVGGA